MATMKNGAEAKKKYQCSRCGKTLSEIKFYKHADGTPDEYCKECLCAHVKNFEPDTFLWILERMDVPYIPSEWNKIRDKKYAEDPKKGTGGPVVMGCYLSKMKLNQWVNKETGKRYTWADTEMLQKKLSNEKTDEELAAEQERNEELKKAYEAGAISEAEYKTLVAPEPTPEPEVTGPIVGPGQPISQQDLMAMFPGADPFGQTFIPEDDLPDPAADLTDEDKIYLALKWGRLYKPNEWIELEKKYDEMMNSFDIQDADTRNTLILMCKTDLKMNQAIDCGDVDGYQKLARVNDGLRKSGKFTAAQNKDKDADQIDCTGVLIAACEREGGFIPRFCTDVPQDMIDISIQDTQKYLYNLVTKDLGFGQQIENYLKKIQLEHENMNRDIDDEEEEITDENIAEYYERIAEEREEDKEKQVDEHSNAYDKFAKEDKEDGIS